MYKESGNCEERVGGNGTEQHNFGPAGTFQIFFQQKHKINMMFIKLRELIKSKLRRRKLNEILNVVVGEICILHLLN